MGDTSGKPKRRRSTRPRVIGAWSTPEDGNTLSPPKPQSQPSHPKSPVDEFPALTTSTSKGPKSSMGSLGTKTSKPETKKLEFKVIRDGLVLLPRFLDIQSQQILVRGLFETHKDSKIGSGGFYELKSIGKDRQMFKLNMGTRGRLIDKVDSYPPIFRKLCLDCLKVGMQVDKTLPSMDPNTILINFYQPNATFKWHKDSEHPEHIRLKTGKPIISFSIGLSCDFGIKDNYEQADHLTLRLNSGDVLLFGGSSRMIVHSVLRVIPGTMPAYLQGIMPTGRLNLTFRDISGGRIDASQFPAYRVRYDDEESESTTSEDSSSSSSLPSIASSTVE